MADRNGLTARIVRRALAVAAAFFALPLVESNAQAATLPDGRTVTPAGFTTPVEGFASSEALSPDGALLAVLCQDGGAVDIIALGEHPHLAQRLSALWASGMTWTKDGLYVTRGYSGNISRFRYNASAAAAPLATQGPDFHIGGLLNGIAENPATHRIIVARTAAQEIVELDGRNGTIVSRRHASGQPFSVAFAGAGIVASLYNSDHLDAWPAGAAAARHIVTGPHPTALLIDGHRIFAANADGHDVAAIDASSLTVTRHYELGLTPNPPAGQTPSGMAISRDGRQLFVAESGFNDVAIVDLPSGRVVARIPTGWYPASVVFVAGSTIDDDPRVKAQLYIASAQGLGTQPDPGSEWNGTYTGIVQHVVVDSTRLAAWSAAVAANDGFDAAAAPQPTGVPPIKHFIFIVHENKHFDEVYGDVAGAEADPTLLLYGSRYTPNAHALAVSYTLFDNFMGNGEKSDFGHSWTTQGMANDYLERTVHTPDDAATKLDARVAGSVWPLFLYGEDAVTPAQMDFDWFKNLLMLPKQPRANVSGVFGPRGELIDELQRKGISFRVYGEQMTMLSNGNIAPGLAAHADRAYPGAHINYSVLDTTRARLFLEDVRAHGLAQYSYLTLPTDHTAGTGPGFYTPASYVASNDVALGQIIAGLSKMPEWRDTVVFVTTDDPQGTGDHLNSHRMPALLIGPYARHAYIEHAQYSIPSVLRTVEVLFGLDPLNMYDAGATPMLGAFATEPDVSGYQAIAAKIPIVKNPGKARSAWLMLDGPGSVAIPNEEWASVKGGPSLVEHLAYLQGLGTGRMVVSEER